MANNQKNQRGGSSQQHSEAGKKGAEARNMQNEGNQGGNQGSNMQGSSNRGFAAMDPEEQRRIASEGGKASHESGHGHEFSSEEAREAGKKGGRASGGNR